MHSAWPAISQTHDRNHFRAREENIGLHHASHNFSGDAGHNNSLHIARANYRGKTERILESVLASPGRGGIEYPSVKELKPTRTVTYRRYGIPAVILEGKWLTDRYQWKMGDQIQIEYLSDEIRLRKSNRAEDKKKIEPGVRTSIQSESLNRIRKPAED